MAPSKKRSIAVGDVIGGKYRVERELGQGGVGIVLQARHMELDQPVAIKVLMLRDDKEQVARFMHEARASVRLRGEHVAKVSDVGRFDDGTPYMVMEFLEGENLSSLTDRGPLSVEDAVTYVLQACEGIAEAHALGIVHRDIKPANLFLTRSAAGRPLVKVLDFGIAKRPDTALDDTRLTGALAVIGSPPYMSPEQVRASRDVDVRSDVWSLGASLYELLTARIPFDGATVQDVCARILTEAPPPLEHWRPGLPAGLQDVIDRCLAKDPALRFPSVWEASLALEPFAPVAARNAERVREILFTPPPSGWRPSPAMPEPPRVEAEGETGTSFGDGSQRTTKKKRVVMASVAAVAGLGVFALAWLHGGSRKDAAPPQGSAGTAAAEKFVTPPTEAAAPSAEPRVPEPAAGAPASASAPAPRPAPDHATPPPSSAASARPAPTPHHPPRPSAPTPPPAPAAHPESTKM